MVFYIEKIDVHHHLIHLFTQLVLYLYCYLGLTLKIWRAECISQGESRVQRGLVHSFDFQLSIFFNTTNKFDLYMCWKQIWKHFGWYSIIKYNPNTNPPTPFLLNSKMNINQYILKGYGHDHKIFDMLSEILFHD